LQHAADALAEFRHYVPRHSAAAHRQVEEARHCLEHAITLLRHAPGSGGPPRSRRLAD
jgi:hypothetical protein